MLKRLVPVAFVAVGIISSSNASAQTISAAAAIEVSAIHQSAHARWQEDYDDAIRGAKTGKVKMYAGLGVLGLGLILGPRLSGDPDSGNAGIVTAIVLDAGGGVLTFWGVRQYLGAINRMALLELSRPAPTTASLRISDHQSVMVGTRTLSYAVSW